jgi:hypothetical protein
MWRRLLPPLAVAVALAVAGAVAAAWTGAVTVSGLGGHFPAVAVDENRNALAVWVRPDGTSVSCCQRVQVRRRTPGGALDDIQNVSAGGRDADSPEVGVDSSGTATIAWVRFDGTSGSCCTRVQVRTRAAGGTLGTTLTLSPPGENSNDPQIAVAPTGAAVVAWVLENDGTSSTCCARIRARVRAADGTYSSQKILSPSGEPAIQPRVAIDGSGDAVVAWTRGTSPTSRVQAKLLLGGVWTPVQTLSEAGEPADDLDVGMSPNAHAIVGWDRPDGSSNTCCTRIQARVRPAGGSFSAIQNFSPSDKNAGEPSVAIDSSQRAYVTWECCLRVQGRSRSPAGVLGTLQTLSGPGAEVSDSHVRMDGAGNAVIEWSRFDGTHWLVDARTRTAAGSLGTIHTLSPSDGSADGPRLAVSSGGSAVVGWTFDTGSQKVQIAAGP